MVSKALWDSFGSTSGVIRPPSAASPCWMASDAVQRKLLSLVLT